MEDSWNYIKLITNHLLTLIEHDQAKPPSEARHVQVGRIIGGDREGANVVQSPAQSPDQLLSKSSTLQAARKLREKANGIDAPKGESGGQLHRRRASPMQCYSAAAGPGACPRRPGRSSA